MYIDKIVTVFGGVAVIPCLISAYNLKGPYGGSGQQIPLWNFTGSAATALLATVCVGWIWTFVLAATIYLALIDPFNLLDKKREKVFQSWWKGFTYDTYGPIYIDVVSCSLGWCAAGVSIFISPVQQISSI